MTVPDGPGAPPEDPQPTEAAPFPDGALLIDKPAGLTSHDVVARVRRRVGGRKAGRVGHTGTLDPFATGLLIVLLGRATRLQDRLMGQDKTYETVARLGATSTTGDPEGEIAVTGRVPTDPPELPTGLVRQRPPAYSAIRVDGERAYKRARRGEDVVVPEREVTVHAFEQLARDGDRASFRIRCSSGTYVRTLVADLGDAYCLELRRTAIGDLSVDDAQSPDTEREDWRLIPLHTLLQTVIPTVELDAEDARRAGFGQRIAVPERPDLQEVGLCHRGEAIAIGRREPDGRVHPVVGFRA
ncbi:tRNA pseudouridine(55) synthase TruB [Patulibacter minatonensis]|uniref:tRNA pseudouridine(55) synthase TruB n=1 Tax=Patulibacter minatonensis TaxID=298163 RepID=UPI000A0727C4|nr:tRNA pseudouridine(55) synthase TruB [Patulibacter minatonensis]